MLLSATRRFVLRLAKYDAETANGVTTYTLSPSINGDNTVVIDPGVTDTAPYYLKSWFNNIDARY